MADSSIKTKQVLISVIYRVNKTKYLLLLFWMSKNEKTKQQRTSKFDAEIFIDLILYHANIYYNFNFGLLKC